MSKKTLITIITLFIALACLAGCDKRENIVLDEAEIEGPVKIRLVQEVRLGWDNYALNVYDSKGMLRATLTAIGTLPEGTMILHDDGKIWVVKNGKRGYILPKQIPSNRTDSLN